MLKNQLIFTVIHGKGQQFVQPKENGDTLSQFAIANIGYIQGNKRQIDAIMTDVVMENDLWHVFNITNEDNIYKKSVAVLGVANIERGRYLAMRYFGDALGVSMEAKHVGAYSYQVIKRFLDHDQSTYHDRISYSDLDHFEKYVSSEAAVWSDEKLISHGGNLSHLMLDMLKNDDDGLLLDSMSKTEFAAFAHDLQDIKEDLYLIEDQQLDALITSYGRMDVLIQRLSQAIGRVGNNKVNVTSITPTKPFKRNNVVNVAILLEFDDGQTVSIIFHNPDATPSKLANADVLTSWKWLLNKRDVSVVLQPQNGENVNLNLLAVRIMQLVNKNSARFKRTQVKRSENEQKLQALQKEEATKLASVQQLDEEIAALQLKIDEANNTNTAAAEQAAAEQAAAEQAAAEQAVTAIDKLIVAVKKRRSEAAVDEWLKISTISEQEAEKVLSIYEDEFDLGATVGGMVSSMIPFNLELLEKEDSSLFSYFNAKPDMVKSLSQSAFDILCQAKNNDNEKTAFYAYTVLRHSNKKSEFDYIHDLGFMKNKFRSASQQVGGKLYKMAMQYLNQTAPESKDDELNEIDTFAQGKDGFSGVLSSITDAQNVKELPDGSWMVLQNSHGYGIAYKLPDGFGISEYAPTLEQAYNNMLEAKEAHLKYPDDQDAVLKLRADKEKDHLNNSDTEYLQSILDGETDLEDTDGVKAKLSDIWSRVEGTDLEPLFNDASNFIKNYALNKYNEPVE